MAQHRTLKRLKTDFLLLIQSSEMFPLLEFPCVPVLVKDDSMVYGIMYLLCGVVRSDCVYMV